MAQKKAPKMRIEGVAQSPVQEGTGAATPAPAKVDARHVDASEKQSNQTSPAPEGSKKKPAVHIDAPTDEPTASAKEVASDGGASGARIDAGAPDAPASRSPYAWVSRIVPGHEHAVLGGLVGLVLALLIFVIGLWQTLFVALLVCVGVAIGQYLDGDPKIIHLLRRLIAGGTGDE